MVTFTRRQMGEDILPSHVNELQEALEANSFDHTIFSAVIQNLQAAVNAYTVAYGQVSSPFTTASTDGATVPDFALTVGANQTWEITYYLYGGSAGADGLTFGIDTPASATLIAAISASDGSSATWVDAVLVSVNALSTGAWMKNTSAGSGIIRAVVNTAGTAGTVNLRVAAKTAGQQAALWAQSRMTARRLV